MPSWQTERLSSVTEEKRLLRRAYRALRKEMTEEQRRTVSDLLVAELRSLPAYASCRTLLCYWPVQGELDLTALARLAMADGKAVAFPISHTSTCTLTFHRISSMGELSAGAYGIPEPPAGNSLADTDASALCLVPALSFDREGYRLGYGKGYYDRFLEAFDGLSLGAVYSPFLADRLPHHPHDRRVDLLITEGGALTPYEKAT